VSASADIVRCVVETEDTRLIVVRGNSASGKSTGAAGLRGKFGRNLVIVGPDNLRRIVLANATGPVAPTPA
jgi:hypothetical protein